MGKKIFFVLVVLVLVLILALVVRIFVNKYNETDETGKEEKILLSLPFSKNDPPDVLIPMGETLEHPKPDNPKGHPGIDFLWQGETGGRLSKIYSSLDGEITAVFPSEGKWDVSVRTGGWLVQYGHLVNLEENIKEGNSLKVGDLIGESVNMHWAFGGYQYFEKRYPDYKCPLKYFSEENQKLLLSIPIMDNHKEAGFTEFCSGDYKEE